MAKGLNCDGYKQTRPRNGRRISRIFLRQEEKMAKVVFSLSPRRRRRRRRQYKSGPTRSFPAFPKFVFFRLGEKS